MVIKFHNTLFERFKELWALYCILIVLIFLSFFVYTKNLLGLRNIWSGIGVSLIGVLITVLLVDTFIEYSKEKEDYKRKQKIYKLLQRPARYYIDKLCHIYHVIYNDKNIYEMSLEQFLKNEFPNALSSLSDLYSKAKAENISYGKFPYKKGQMFTEDGDIYTLTYIEALKQINDTFYEDAENIISKYAFFLDTETMELFEDLKHTEYSKNITFFESVSIGFISNSALKEDLQKHNQLLLEFIGKIFQNNDLYVKKSKIRKLKLHIGTDEY